MSNEICHRFRYDYFIIWGNSLQHTEAIREILRKEEDLEIIKIVSHKIKEMKRFVLNLYGCDPVPLWHLQAKLSYLFKAKPEAIFIFVKNLAPNEIYVDDGPFRHIHCQYIARIKENIRNLYNPRKNGVRTEEHVIHASDQEAQVDYFLKMLGYSDGIYHLHNSGSALPIRKPYHIPKPKTYRFKRLSINDLRASILVHSPSQGVNTELRKIHDTPHFRTLKYGDAEYKEYLENFQYTLLTDDYSQTKFLEMSRLDRRRIEAFYPILVTPLNGSTAVSLFCGFKTMNCVEFDQ